MANRKQKKAILIALAAPLMFSPAPLMAATGPSEPVVAIARQAQTIVSVQRINPTTVDVVFSNNQRMTFDFYGDNIFRMFQDNNGGILRDPEAKPEARILVDTPRRPVSKLDIQDDNGQVTITTGKVRLQLDKSTALLKVTNLTTNKIVFEETKPVVYEKGKTILTLKENPDEYFYGGGVQIMGESGIGKSEAALELIKRGHRLVSDDVVEIRKVSDETLVGTAPDITRHFIELRGIGIVDVKTLFGVQSVRETKNIALVITLEEWNKEREYDRLGLEDQYTEFLGNKVVCHNLPIRPGRNLAIIVETAAINHRQKSMGYNAAQELYQRVQRNLTKKD